MEEATIPAGGTFDVFYSDAEDGYPEADMDSGVGPAYLEALAADPQAREAMVDRVAELMHEGSQGGRAIFGPDGSGGWFYTEDSYPPLRQGDVVVTVPYRRGKRPTRWWAGLAVDEALGSGEEGA